MAWLLAGAVEDTRVFEEMIGHAGFDYVLIDTEHASTCATSYELENMIRAAYVADITLLVRVTVDDPAMIKNALNFGAYGIVAPHVMSKDKAERITEAARFFPEGRRGIGIRVRQPSMDSGIGGSSSESRTAGQW